MRRRLSAKRTTIDLEKLKDNGVEISSLLSNKSSLVSQLTSIAYHCNLAADQTNATPPTANYRANLSCSVGKPLGIVFSIYNSNVNFPSTKIYLGPNNYTCPAGSTSCTTPTYARTVTRTQYLRVYVGVNILGSDGITYTVSAYD